MKKTILAIFIICVIFIYLVFNMMDRLNLISSFSYKNNCKTIHHEVGERNIILRVDDIQAYAWWESQERIIKDAMDRDMTLVLGIIPYVSKINNFQDDKRIYNLVKENRCSVEIALHGYTHQGEEGEFADLSFEEADKKIRKGLEILNKIEPNVLTFIPPNNKISNESLKALNSYGIEIVSAGYLEGDYGFTSSVFDWENKKLENYSDVINECNEILNQNKTCIIMIHPQDYVNENGELDEKKYKNYLGLLNGIEELNATIVNFRDMSRKDYIFVN